MKRDGRTLDHRTLEEIRRMAVQQVREGERPSTVVAAYGFCRTTIYKWLGRVARRGMRALAARTATGRPRRLTAAQARQVFRWVNGQDPRQYHLDCGLWTRQVVAELIERKFGVRLGVTAVGALLARRGLTPQKPWQRDTWPALPRQAKAQGAHVLCWDESGFRADTVHGKTWGVRGQTPVVHRPGQRQSISAASAVSAQGAFWCCTYPGALNAEQFVDLLKTMMRHRNKSVHLVLDGLPAHQQTCVRDYVAATKGRLTLHCLPGYAPDLNPDELGWSHVKRTGAARRPLQKGETLRDRITQHLEAIRHMPRLVRSFFQAPSVAYITD